jgi:hypothetical protein
VAIDVANITVFHFICYTILSEGKSCNLQISRGGWGAPTLLHALNPDWKSEN